LIRFDYISREERYFSATILPFLLASNNFNGLKTFLEFINKKFFHNTKHFINTSEFEDSIDSIQLVSEPTFERDLSYYKIPIPKNSFEKRGTKRPKPDLLIIYRDWAMLFEAKFFTSYSSYQFANQIFEQTYLLDIIKNLSNNKVNHFHQFGISPIDETAPDINLISWDEIYDEMRKIFPSNEYYLNVLKKAIDRFKLGIPKVDYFY